MQQTPKISPSAIWVIVGSICICIALGTVHGFSVFLEPLEVRIGGSRATISLTYSFALIALTALVLIGPRLYPRLSPSVLMLVTGVMAAAGAFCAGQASEIGSLWLSYSLAFGAANGLGYGFTLQYSGQVAKGREGLAMGLVTAGYALGAVVSPWAFQQALNIGGFSAAMTGLSLFLACAAGIAALCFHRSGIRFMRASSMSATPPLRRIFGLWCSYGAAVLAGLMAIGHAAAIASQANIAVPSWWAPAVLSSCNLLGSLFAGALADRLRPAGLLVCLALITALALTMMSVYQSTVLLLLAFGGVGLAYGGTIAAYPAVIAKRFGREIGPQVYGYVFTAWGAAGLAGPWIAGAMFDQRGTYAAALGLAAMLAILSASSAFYLFGARDNQGLHK